MHRYRPQTKTIVIGLSLMIAGILCWCLFAPFKKQANLLFLMPLGLFLLCLGGLELTLTALVTLHKNDLVDRQRAKEKEQEQKTKS